MGALFIPALLPFPTFVPSSFLLDSPTPPTHTTTMSGFNFIKMKLIQSINGYELEYSEAPDGVTAQELMAFRQDIEKIYAPVMASACCPCAAQSKAHKQMLAYLKLWSNPNRVAKHHFGDGRVGTRDYRQFISIETTGQRTNYAPARAGM